MEMIVAVAKNNVIGDTVLNRLLWNLPEDLARFSRLTAGHLVIMGHKTYQSLPNGKLKNRINVVLTNHPPSADSDSAATEGESSAPKPKDLYFVNLASLWDVLLQHPDKKVFVIGGSAIYELLFPYCSKIHYTAVDVEPEGNVFFPFSRDELAIASYSLEETPMETSATPERLRYQYFTYYLE